MSCFIHHMINKGIFNDLGIIASEENADDLGEKIAKIVGLSGSDCSKVWEEVSRWLDNPSLRNTLRKKLASEDQSTAPTPNYHPQ